MVAPGSIAFPPLVATQEWDHDRPAIGQIYQSVGGDDLRTELNSAAPVLAAHEVECATALKPEILDLLFPNASPARRAASQRFLRYGSVSLISTTLGLAILGVLIGACGYPAIWANIVATAVGTIPSFELNRRWVWAQNGERSILRQAVPYFLLSLRAWWFQPSQSISRLMPRVTHRVWFTPAQPSWRTSLRTGRSGWSSSCCVTGSSSVRRRRMKACQKRPSHRRSWCPTKRLSGPARYRDGEFRGSALNPRPESPQTRWRLVSIRKVPGRGPLHPNERTSRSHRRPSRLSRPIPRPRQGGTCHRRRRTGSPE
jgi:putative flippase GtrA